MAITTEEIAAIIDAVKATGLTYMMGETSEYNPATVHARNQIAEGAFGRLFYAEGDYVHDMDLGFYEAYQYSGGENWKATASYPPLLYPTHAVGGVLGAWQTHAVSVSAIGVVDDRGDGVFDKEVSQFGNDFSNATALFEVAGGGSFRTNEFRRVGYPSHIRESRFRFFGTEASMEQLATVALWQDKEGVKDISELLEPKPTMAPDDPSLQHIAPELRAAFTSGSAPVHDRARLPREFDNLHNGHEGSHHFLVDDFVTAVNTPHPAVGERVGGRPLHAAGHHRARVRAAGRGAAGDPGLRGRPPLAAPARAGCLGSGARLAAVHEDVVALLQQRPVLLGVGLGHVDAAVRARRVPHADADRVEGLAAVEELAVGHRHVVDATRRGRCGASRSSSGRCGSRTRRGRCGPGRGRRRASCRPGSSSAGGVRFTQAIRPLFTGHLPSLFGFFPTAFCFCIRSITPQVTGPA